MEFRIALGDAPWGRAVIVSQIISRTVVSTSLWRRPVKDTRLVNKRGKYVS